MRVMDTSGPRVTILRYLAVPMILSLLVATGWASPPRTVPNRPELLPPGALVWHGPNPGSASAAAAGTNAPSAASQVPLKLSPALAEIMRLHAAGVEDQVLLKSIQNSPPFRSITPDELIYLKSRGVSARVLTALLQHQAEPHDGVMPEAGAYPARFPWAGPVPGRPGGAPGVPTQFPP